MSFRRSGLCCSCAAVWSISIHTFRTSRDADVRRSLVRRLFRRGRNGGNLACDQNTAVLIAALDGLVAAIAAGTTGLDQTGRPIAQKASACDDEAASPVRNVRCVLAAAGKKRKRNRRDHEPHSRLPWNLHCFYPY